MNGKHLPIVTAVALGLLASLGAKPTWAQEDVRVRRAIEALIADMTPAERVGQIFVVPFPGDSVSTGTALARLIDVHHVGGVLLDPTHGNFSNDGSTPTRVAVLAEQVQRRYSQGHASALPVFVALAEQGDAFPASPLYGGMTPLPSQLAIGATWDAARSEAIGELVGRELAAVGVNLLLGPSLDVHADPRPGSTGDLGVSSFGGSPAWVGRMGAAFVAGVHEGSVGRVATAVGSYPGIGGADRSQTQEIAVVERALEQMLETDLPPFVTLATGGGEESVGISDAMLTTHVRYRSIQRQAERPFALDSNGLRFLDGQIEALERWRENGGVRISPGLGLPSVRRYVDAELELFSPRRVIREALLAGHDLLLLDGFDTGDDGAMVDTQEIEEGIAWLVGEYEADEAVRARVDDAVVRVLSLKHRLHGGLEIETVPIEAEAIARQVGKGEEVVLDVAREALTLIGPSDGSNIDSPQAGEKILLVVDARQRQDCPTCASYLDLDPEALLGTLRRAYGPEGSGTARLRDNQDAQAITYRDLDLWMQDTGAAGPDSGIELLERVDGDRLAEEVSELFEAASWIVFAMLDPQPAEAPSSAALRRFLASRTGAEAEAQRIVALAFEAPYQLDTTEIAGLHALYAVYARTPPFVEVAVRALFGDVSPGGASPVSVAGAGYDLSQQLRPAMDQAVSLEPVGWATEQEVRLGDTFRVRTSPILDRNGNLVPDGTPIAFRRYMRSGDVFLQDVPATTLRGRAMASVRAEREGEVELSADHDSEALGEPLVVRIGPGIEIEATNSPLPLLRRGVVPVDWGIMLLSMSLILLAGVLVYGVDPDTVRSPVLLVRMFLLSLAWGLAGYLMVAAGGIRIDALPGGVRLWPPSWSPAYQAPLLSFACAVVPVVPTLVRAIRARRS